MSGKRSTLAINKLDGFKQWLDSKEIPHRPGKGDYEVLQVRVPNYGWQCVFRRHDMKEHYTVERAYLLPLVRRFINEQK